MHDNQGVAGLLEQDCNVLLVSDASGQMGTQDDPGSGLLGVPLRANNILMSRVREAEYYELVARRRSSLLRGFMFIHLKKDLDEKPIGWLGCAEPEIQDSPAARDRKSLTSYGIHKDLQRRLAAIRTDLDSFSDAEAYALMTSGYHMTKYEFARCIEGFPQSEEGRERWRFLEIEETMKREPKVAEESQALMELLEVASSKAFKIWRLSKPLRVTGRALVLAAVIAFFWFCWLDPGRPVLKIEAVAWALASILIVAAANSIFGERAGGKIGRNIVKVMRPSDTLTRIGIGLGMGVIGWLVALIHLLLFDSRYLSRGSIDRVVKSKATSSGT